MGLFWRHDRKSKYMYSVKMLTSVTYPQEMYKQLNQLKDCNIRQLEKHELGVE